MFLVIFASAASRIDTRELQLYQRMAQTPQLCQRVQLILLFASLHSHAWQILAMWAFLVVCNHNRHVTIPNSGSTAREAAPAVFLWDCCDRISGMCHQHLVEADASRLFPKTMFSLCAGGPAIPQLARRLANAAAARPLAGD